MMLGGDVRGADAAVWRATELGSLTSGFARVPPVLAVEVAGKDEEPDALVEKARWYLDHGVEVVWILDPRTRTARVVSAEGQAAITAGTMPERPSLPGLAPRLDDQFRQVSQG